MGATNEQVSTTRFLEYVGEFRDIANSGLTAAQRLFGAIAIAQSIDPTTANRFENIVSHKSELVVSLQAAYEHIYTEAIGLPPMQDTFVALANHIKDWTGQTVDQYLTSNSMQVNQTYANIHRMTTTEVISSANIS